MCVVLNVFFSTKSFRFLQKANDRLGFSDLLRVVGKNRKHSPIQMVA